MLSDSKAVPVCVIGNSLYKNPLAGISRNFSENASHWTVIRLHCGVSDRLGHNFKGEDPRGNKKHC
ncbi:Hypothetical protein Cp262_0903 [Corynebacterium pseudotuberculosis]|nr:Hypothetical protein Cp262_0903 [Corynebacterium pseudotuberculosis]